MQEIKKRRIVIASVLKPVDDTRMFEKIGRTLSASHEVHVIGFGAASAENISLMQHPIGVFPRVSLSRLLAPWRILNIVLKLRPDVLMICTHELLCQGVLARLFLRCQLWYDVQENYARNISSSQAFPPVIRSLVAVYVRLKEMMIAPLVNRFLLAEQSYGTELKFTAKRGALIENKVRRDEITVKTQHHISNEKLKLVFTGTLSELTGVFVAIDIAEAMHAIRPVSLEIVGFCAQISERRKLFARCKDLDFVTLNTGDIPLPHRVIIDAIAYADVGIISYPQNAATWSCIPTKFYEYLASRLPILLINNPRWIKLAAKCNAAVVFDSRDFKPHQTLDLIRDTTFYSIDPQDVYWEDEATKLLSLT